MKNTKNFLLTGVSCLLVLSSVGANAMYDQNAGSGEQLRENGIMQTRMLYRVKRVETKEMRAELIEAGNERRAQMKENFADFKNQEEGAREAFADLSDEIKEELKGLKEEHQEATNEIKEEFKNTELTLEEREELKEELKKLNEEFAEKVKELVGENEEANDFLEKREELKMKNQELRNEQKQARREFREERSELVNKYKEAYLSKLAVAIPRIKDSKLEQISTKIDAIYEKIESNTRISEDKKEKILSQIISLKEIMDEELESRDEELEELDLDAIFE